MNQNKLREVFEEIFKLRNLNRLYTDSNQYKDKSVQDKWIGFRSCAIAFEENIKL